MGASVGRPPQPSFARDITPLLNRDCNTCHTAGSTLWPLVGYENVRDWAYSILLAVSLRRDFSSFRSDRRELAYVHPVNGLRNRLSGLLGGWWDIGTPHRLITQVPATPCGHARMTQALLEGKDRLVQWSWRSVLIACPPADRFAIVSANGELRPHRLQNLSKNWVDSRGLSGTREDSRSTRNPKEARTLATKDEQHRRLRNYCSLGFKPRRSPRDFAGKSASSRFSVGDNA
jgi:hypothetical protein